MKIYTIMNSRAVTYNWMFSRLLVSMIVFAILLQLALSTIHSEKALLPDTQELASFVYFILYL